MGVLKQEKQMLQMQSPFRKELVEIAKADAYADSKDVAAFVEEMETAGLYGNATEDELERFDEII